MNQNIANRLSRCSRLTLLITSLFVLQGCVVFLSTVATIYSMKGSSHATTTVLINKTPDVVYAAMDKIIQENPELKVLNRNEDEYLIEASRGKNNMTATATSVDLNTTQLIVTADSGEKGTSSEELALRVVTKICDELIVDYRIANN